MVFFLNIFITQNSRYVIWENWRGWGPGFNFLTIKNIIIMYNQSFVINHHVVQVYKVINTKFRTNALLNIFILVLGKRKRNGMTVKGVKRDRT